MSKEEILKVLPEKKKLEAILREACLSQLRNAPIGGDWDATKAIFVNEAVIEHIVDKIIVDISSASKLAEREIGVENIVEIMKRRELHTFKAIAKALKHEFLIIRKGK